MTAKQPNTRGKSSAPQAGGNYVGTIVGESTSREFRLAVAHEALREQDIIAVDAELRPTDGSIEKERLRVWAKVQRVERLNPLFPTESGHELAATRTNPFDTVLSLSREMVTAVCQVLGAERIGENKGGKLDQLRYPAQPATSAYRPDSADIARVVLGELEQKNDRALDIATLSNRPEVDVKVDGHSIVTRHLAILAMTGAGKSWTARRIIEELAKKNYPIVIFDPHGDYTGLADVPAFSGRVTRYYAQFPIFEQPSETVVTVVESLGWKLAKTHQGLFDDLFNGAAVYLAGTPAELKARTEWLSKYLKNDNIEKYGLKPNLFFLADFTQAVIQAGKEQDITAQDKIVEWSGREQLKIKKQNASWLEALPSNLRRAAKRLYQMEEVSKKVAKTTEPLPTERIKLVQYRGISIVALAGYTGDFQATIYSLIAESIFNARVSEELKLPVLLLLEEAHNFVPAKANTAAEEYSIAITKQIAQEGRKFGVGLILISQRPSRLDETTLSQCNSYIIMRLVNPADQNFVRKVVESLGEDDAKMLPNLDVGEALLSGQLINFPVLVKVKPPASQGEHEEEDAFEALKKAYAEVQKTEASTSKQSHLRK
jgi:Predicted ATPase